MDLTDISAVVNALPGSQKQFTDYFFYVEGQATTDDGFYFSDTLRGVLRFDTENDKFYQSRDEGQQFLRYASVEKTSGDLLELKEVDFSYLPVENLSGNDAVGAPDAPSFEVSLSSITEDQTDATGVRVGANLAVTFASTKPSDESWLMTVSRVPSTGTLSKGARDASSGDWYILVPPGEATTTISVRAGRHENISGNFLLSVYVTSTKSVEVQTEMMTITSIVTKSTTSPASIVSFVVTPVADETFIRAPRFVGKNPDGSEILEDQVDKSGDRIPIKIPISIELPDGGESLDNVVITGLPEGGSLQLMIVVKGQSKGSAVESDNTTYTIPGSIFGIHCK